MELSALMEAQRNYYRTGATRSLAFRELMLDSLYRKIREMEPAIHAALQADLGKSAFESYMCETGLTLSEISYMKTHLRDFAAKKRVRTPIAQFPSRSYVLKEPYGCVLIMSPWNYPFMLTLEPLADAIAAGNTVILKPSAYSPATSAVIKKLIAAVFPGGICGGDRGRQGRKPEPSGAEIRLYFLHRRHRGRQAGAAKGRRAFHPGDPGDGRKKPLHCG